GFWIVMVLAVAMLTVGGGGLIYRLLRIGASDERRSAIRAGSMELLRPATADVVPLPSVPQGRGLTDSPGVHQAYRLASEGANRACTVAESATLSLLWNATWFVLLAVVV